MTAPLSLFVTGTDTEIGKTFVSAAMLHGFARHGLRGRAETSRPARMNATACGATRTPTSSTRPRTSCCRPSCARRSC